MSGLVRKNFKSESNEKSRFFRGDFDVDTSVVKTVHPARSPQMSVSHMESQNHRE